MFASRNVNWEVHKQRREMLISEFSLKTVRSFLVTADNTRTNERRVRTDERPLWNWELFDRNGSHKTEVTLGHWKPNAFVRN
jgi:hypothetical protein